MAVNTSGYAQIVPPADALGVSAGYEENQTQYWTLAKVKRAYLDYIGAKNEEIQEQQSARCYRHGAQWTVSQVEIFNKRKQPVVTYNRIGRKIDAIVGLMERLKQDPKAYPRNPRTTSEAAADLATSVVRYVVEAELHENRFPFAIEQAAVDGIGGIEIILERGDKEDIDIGFALVQSDSFFYDARSYMHDFSDARYMGQGKWMDLEDVQGMFPDRAKELAGMIQSGSDLTSSPDRERRWFQVTPDFRRLRVIEIWYKNLGGWSWCIFTGAAKLAEGDGYFYNEKNKQICKFIMFSSFIDHDGDRYGFVRNLRSSQDEINQRRSKGLRELNSRRISAEDGAFSDIEVARREAVRPDGVVIYNKGFEMKFDDQTRIANVEGQFKFLEDAKAEIENFGPNPALIGQGLEYKSGRAINLLQQAGIAELGPFVIGVRNWKLRVYRAIWCAVQRYWTAERFIRITDVQGLPQMVQINGVGVDPMTGFPRLVNALGNLDVNFVLDEGPDEVNIQADAYDTLVALTQQGAKIPPQILIELSPLQGEQKRKLLAILSQPDPAAQAAQQVALASEQAKIQETQSKTALNFGKAREAQQGGAHGIVERQMDMAQSAQEHQAKMNEAAIKAAAEQNTARLGAATEFMRLQSQGLQSQQKLVSEAARNAQKLRHAEEMHRTKLQQAATRPNGGQK